MAVPHTALHDQRIVSQIETMLLNVQRDMRNNATAHLAMAQGQTVPLAALQGFVADCAQLYLRNLQWVIDLRADSARKARLVAALGKIGWTEADIVDVVQAVRPAAIALRDAPRGSYAEIVTACQAVLAAVDAPDTLWPE